MVRNLLNNYLVCEINIEKSNTALLLEKRFNIDWSFEEYNHLEPTFQLRACIEEPVTIQPGEIKLIPTGIYPQILNPRFEIEIRSSSALLYEKRLVQADGITYFPYTFRNEIYIFLENKNIEAQVVHPADEIALFSVKQQPKMVIKWVHQIEESPWKTNSSKSFINKIKKKKRSIIKQGKTYERNEL